MRIQNRFSFYILYIFCGVDPYFRRFLFVMVPFLWYQLFSIVLKMIFPQVCLFVCVCATPTFTNIQIINSVYIRKENLFNFVISSVDCFIILQRLSCNLLIIYGPDLTVNHQIGEQVKMPFIRLYQFRLLAFGLSFLFSNIYLWPKCGFAYLIHS